MYEHLQAHPLPIKGALDYFEVFFSLCDILSLAYSKFLDHSCQSSPAVLEAILKVCMSEEACFSFFFLCFVVFFVRWFRLCFLPMLSLLLLLLSAGFFPPLSWRLPLH